MTDKARADRFRRSYRLRSLALPLGVLVGLSLWGSAGVLPAASAATPATIVSNTPLPFATTNGDVLAVKTIDVSGQVVAVFGGDFSTVKTQDGVTHSAANLAAVNETTGALAFAASSISEDGYVRALAYQSGVLYVGGSFTTFNGTARSHLLALAVPGWTLTTWNATTSDEVESLDADAAGVYVGGAFGLIKDLSPSTGATIWSDPVVGGGVRALLADDANGGLYAAGFFDSVGTENNHGMVELNLATGAPIPAFAPVLQPNSGMGAAGSYDGEDPMDLALNTSVVPNQLLMGSGGHQNFVRMLNLTTGANIWDHETPGDAQAVAMVGTSALVGYHRNRPNSSSFPYPYYAAQLSGTNGAIGAWQAGLSGFPGQIPDGGNNGVRGLAYNPTTNILVVVGAFTTYGATCNPATTTTCTGGTKLNSIAAYSGRHRAAQPAADTLGAHGVGCHLDLGRGDLAGGQRRHVVRRAARGGRHQRRPRRSRAASRARRSRTPGSRRGPSTATRSWR